MKPTKLKVMRVDQFKLNRLRKIRQVTQTPLKKYPTKRCSRHNDQLLAIRLQALDKVRSKGKQKPKRKMKVRKKMKMVKNQMLVGKKLTSRAPSRPCVQLLKRLNQNHHRVFHQRSSWSLTN